MVTRPGYIYGGPTDGWVSIGQDAAVSPFKYQATAPTSPATGDIWIDSSSTVNSIDSTQLLRWRKTMVGGETSLSGNDDSSLSLQYTPNYEQVYINGVLQVRGVDYTATTGTTITGLTALVVNDVVEVFSAVARTVTDVYTQAQSDNRFVNKTVGGMSLVIPTGATNGTVNPGGSVTIGSGVTSIAVNGCFSSAYDNYRITIDGGSCTGGNIEFYFQLQGITTGVYNSNLSYNTFGANQATTGVSATNASVLNWCGTSTANGHQFLLDLFGPNAARFKWGKGTFIQMSAGTNNGESRHYIASTVQSTGFTLTISTGTVTGGTIRIYGYNNGA